MTVMPDYPQLNPTSLDAAWMEFYSVRHDLSVPRDTLRSRNRLILHYAPIAKYVALRIHGGRDISRPPIAEALVALTRAIDEREDGDLSDWSDHVVRVCAAACAESQIRG
jgi:hypothetical protein